LGIGDWAQSPIPNPQSPIPNPQSKIPILYIFLLIIFLSKNIYFYKDIMGSSSSLYIKEKDIKNNVISVPNSALKVIADLAEKCI